MFLVFEKVAVIKTVQHLKRFTKLIWINTISFLCEQSVGANTFYFQTNEKKKLNLHKIDNIHCDLYSKIKNLTQIALTDAV